MPPTRDQRLEERILKAAQRLWRTRGEKGLTLRAVAHAAATTPPTVYNRFRNKAALRLALTQRLQAQLQAECLAASSLEDVCRRYLGFAEKHPHEYRLLWADWGRIFGPHRPRPIRAWLLSQLANRFGGKPEDYEHLFYALWLLSHGAASLTTLGADAAASAEVRENYFTICDTLLQRADILRSQQ